ncbi:MAG: hypothetical protein QHG99_03920 [Methanomicrobiales archaeon]|nr:hypothetical protein [Methanomicrobiales archaeon]
MKKLLNEYIERIRPIGNQIGAPMGHRIALAMLTFKMGLYTDSEQRCIEALEDREGYRLPPFVRKALDIVRARAHDLAENVVLSPNLPDFEGPEMEMVPIRISPQVVDDPVRLRVSNAVIVLYATALASSPDDAPALEEQERYILQLYMPYMKLLEG